MRDTQHTVLKTHLSCNHASCCEPQKQVPAQSVRKLRAVEQYEWATDCRNTNVLYVLFVPMLRRKL